MTKTYTEDDTYERLRRVPFVQTMEEFRQWDITNDSTTNRIDFMEARGWTWYEFLVENARRRKEGLPHIN